MICSRCGEEKELRKFPTSKETISGRYQPCNMCRHKREATSDPLYRDKDAARKRRRYATNEQYRKKMIRKAVAREARVRKSPKSIARTRLHQAVKTGKIIKPDACVRCGAKPGKRKIHGHHSDYSKPYAVEWVCQPCHLSAHKEIAKAKGLQRS